MVGNGKQALSILETACVDVVLTDIHMPVMDGYALLEVLRETHPRLPVLAFSAITRNEQAEDWQRRGFAGHVAKPASLDDLELALWAIRIPQADASDTSPAPDRAAGTASAYRARYDAILRKQLQTDLPELEAILARQDVEALRAWAHRCAGALVIVQQPDLLARLTGAPLRGRAAVAIGHRASRQGVPRPRARVRAGRPGAGLIPAAGHLPYHNWRICGRRHARR